MPSRRPIPWICMAVVGLAACASTPQDSQWQFDVPLGDAHVFHPVVLSWQAAHELEPLRPADLQRAQTPLSHGYRQFRSELRRQLAAQVLDWVRDQSATHFRHDGPVDHWPTLPQLLRAGSDDCDGLELLTFQLLRELGFGRGEIYRAVVANRDTGKHHMVTLYFPEGLDADPLVLDPLSRVVSGLTPLSRARGWFPVVLFDEREGYQAVLRE